MRGFAAMLFALNRFFVAAKSNAFTVGLLEDLAKSRKLESTLDVLCHLYQTNVASVFAALLLLFVIFFQFN